MEDPDVSQTQKSTTELQQCQGNADFFFSITVDAPSGQTINKEYYCEDLRFMRDAVHQKKADTE